MNLQLRRFEFSDNSTIGELSIDGIPHCYTLEDVDRHLEENGEKIYGKTAIPRGEYGVILDWSKRFKDELPRLLDVPQFEGVRIHAGNSNEDTEGCILVGSRYAVDYVYNSRATLNNLIEQLEEALNSGEDIILEIV